MDLEKIRSMQWYKQGAIAIPWFIHNPYMGSMDAIGEDEIITYRGKENIGYFNKKEELKGAERIIEKEKKEEYVLELRKRWRKKAGGVLELLKENFSEMNNQKLVEYIQKISNELIDSWKTGAIIELFDPWGEEIVEKELEKHGSELKEEELISLTSTLEPNIIQKEKRDRLKLVKENGNLEKHVEKYFFIENSWGEAKILNKEYFLGLVKDQKLEWEVKKINENFENLKKEKNRLKEILPGKLFRVLDLFSKLSAWREERKEWVMAINHKLYELLEELSKRTGIEREILEFAVPGEIKEIPLSKEYVEEVKKRINRGVYTKEYGWIYGEKAKEIIETLEESFESSEIRGNIACKGIGKGKARIIRTYDDFKNMNQGDILVTIMTRPEHLPLMKKAAAIITDEGGITCHAAIVSRELGIPCIVGTQIASSVLNEGELVEVDANKGIVKRCST